jgi:hypothetical protein
MSNGSWPFGLALVWFAFCFVWGIAGGFLSAEFGQYGLARVPISLLFGFIGLAFALGLPILPVRLAKRGNKGVPTLLSYCAGFELVAIWVVLPAVFPSSWATPENPVITFVFGAILAGLGLGIASASLFPAVRGRWR